ncbi:hypothetical protein [Croceibacterium mercuriale]|nr:hypothetical protein [Croceibacterium mercuriale]
MLFSRARLRTIAALVKYNRGCRILSLASGSLDRATKHGGNEEQQDGKRPPACKAQIS